MKASWSRGMQLWSHKNVFFVDMVKNLPSSYPVLLKHMSAETDQIRLHIYSRLSLFRRRLSRITVYLEMKIWSMFSHENRTTGNSFKLRTCIHLWKVAIRFILSSVLQIGYVKGRIPWSASDTPLYFEIRVDRTKRIISAWRAKRTLSASENFIPSYTVPKMQK